MEKSSAKQYPRLCAQHFANDRALVTRGSIETSRDSLTKI